MNMWGALTGAPRRVVAIAIHRHHLRVHVPAMARTVPPSGIRTESACWYMYGDGCAFIEPRGSARRACASSRYAVLGVGRGARPCAERARRRSASGR